MRHNIINAFKITTLALVLSFGLSYVYAWTVPTSAPPAGNVSAPINTSATAQTKYGNLTVGNIFLDANNGSVGIGTTNPAQKLDVAGNINLPSNGSLLVMPEISGNTSYSGITSANGVMSDGVPWYFGVGREAGAWPLSPARPAMPYPQLVLNNHTGIRLTAHGGYGGVSVYEQLNAASTDWTSVGREVARFRDNAYGGSIFNSNVTVPDVCTTAGKCLSAVPRLSCETRYGTPATCLADETVLGGGCYMSLNHYDNSAENRTIWTEIQRFTLNGYECSASTQLEVNSYVRDNGTTAYARCCKII